MNRLRCEYKLPVTFTPVGGKASRNIVSVRELALDHGLHVIIYSYHYFGNG